MALVHEMAAVVALLNFLLIHEVEKLSTRLAFILRFDRMQWSIDGDLRKKHVRHGIFFIHFLTG